MAGKVLDLGDGDERTLEIRYKGETFTLDANLGLEFTDALGEIAPLVKASREAKTDEDRSLVGLEMGPKFSSALAAVFGEDEWKRFRALKPSFNDLLRVIDALVDAAGFEGPGESSASAGS